MNRMLPAIILLATASAVTAADKKVVFLAGGASHGGGDHEHRAGCLLFKSCLEKVPGVVAEVHVGGYAQTGGKLQHQVKRVRLVEF